MTMTTYLGKSCSVGLLPTLTVRVFRERLPVCVCAFSILVLRVGLDCICSPSLPFNYIL